MEIKNCKECGSYGEICVVGLGPGFQCYIVKCHSCGNQIEDASATEIEAVQKWNEVN